MTWNEGWIVKSCPETDSYGGAWTLVSFDLFIFLYFIGITTIAGPFLYRVAASAFNWERHYISLVGYLTLFYENITLAYVLFTLGNYAHTFNYLTVIFYFVGLFGYSFLVQLPFLQVSLPTWRTWSFGAWAVHLGGLSVVLLAAAYFIYQASVDGFIGPYLLAFFIATGFLWIPVIINKINSMILTKYPNSFPFSRTPKYLLLKLKSYDYKILHFLKKKQVHDRAAIDSNPSSPSNSIDNDDILSDSDNSNEDPISNPDNSINPLMKEKKCKEDLAENSSDINLPKTPTLSSLSSSDNNKTENASTSGPKYNLEISNMGKFSGKELRAELRNKEIFGSKFFEDSIDNVSTHPESANRPIINELSNRPRLVEISEEELKPKYLGVSSANPSGRVKYRVHLHHWQIFYVLAFFTRFQSIPSRIAAGLVLGIYTQGATAYGHDHLLLKCATSASPP
ncbi:hypothetical protein AYI68_g5970 [Smittium mucronatum]|uniref:Uncharacterized protein n=1 Tax=Smittium mucronatum TaxID=133383 RepID=A0A1R0GST6_9FUNG|nr:hypothetical protein AYI68_g5970 [Smittium mucronatum]